MDKQINRSAERLRSSTPHFKGDATFYRPSDGAPYFSKVGEAIDISGKVNLFASFAAALN
jgi:hypothetical protein